MFDEVCLSSQPGLLIENVDDLSFHLRECHERTLKEVNFLHQLPSPRAEPTNYCYPSMTLTELEAQVINTFVLLHIDVFLPALLSWSTTQAG